MKLAGEPAAALLHAERELAIDGLVGLGRMALVCKVSLVQRRVLAERCSRGVGVGIVRPDLTALAVEAEGTVQTSSLGALGVRPGQLGVHRGAAEEVRVGEGVVACAALAEREAGATEMVIPAVASEASRVPRADVVAMGLFHGDARGSEKGGHVNLASCALAKPFLHSGNHIHGVLMCDKSISHVKKVRVFRLERKYAGNRKSLSELGMAEIGGQVG